MEVVPVSETEPVLDDDDAADDSVVLSSMDGQRVWIVGTNKRRGLVWYDIQGEELGRLEVGRLNNVDAVRIGDTNRFNLAAGCLLYTSPSPRDRLLSRMPSSA